jgi:hypothetical protein
MRRQAAIQITTEMAMVTWLILRKRRLSGHRAHPFFYFVQAAVPVHVHLRPSCTLSQFTRPILFKPSDHAKVDYLLDGLMACVSAIIS